MKQLFSGDLSDVQLRISLSVLLACFYVIWTFSGELANLGGDSAAYVLAAKILISFGDLSPAMEEYSKGLFFPPVFPMYLGLLGGGVSLHAAHIAISLAAATTLYLMAQFLLEEGLPGTLALAGTALFAISPVMLFQVFNIWSEHLLLASLMLVVLLVSLHEKSGSQSDFRWLLLIVSLAPLIKVSGLAIVLALVLYFGARRGWKKASLSLLAIAPFLVWQLFRGHLPGVVSPYATHWGAQYAGLSWSDIFTKLVVGVDAVADSWIAGWSGANIFFYQKPLAVLLGIIILTGLWADIRKYRYYAIFVVVHISMMIAWGHPEEAMRYGLVLYPFGILAGYRGVKILASVLAHNARTTQLVFKGALVCAGLVVLPEAGRAILLRIYPLDEGLIEARTTSNWYFLKDRRYALYQAVSQQKIIEQMKRMKEIVPEDQCIFSVKYTNVMLYTDRYAISPPPESADDASFERAIGSCRYIHAQAYAIFHKSEFYPLGRLAGYKVLDSAELNGSAEQKRIFAVLAIQG